MLDFLATVVAILLFFPTIAHSQERIWTKQITGTSTTNLLNTGVSLDNSGSFFYLAGTINEGVNAGGNDIALIKFSSNGTRIWTKQVGTATEEQSTGVAYDATSDSVYISGYVAGSLHGETSSGSYDLCLLKYGVDGTRAWTRLVGSTANDGAYGVGVDSTGAAYLAGYAGGSIDGQTFAGGSADIVLVKYATNGTREWTRMVGSSGNDRAYGVAADSSGNVFVTGFAGGSLNGETYLGDTDFFLLKYSNSGTLLWTRLAGTVGEDYTYAVRVDSAGAAYAVGYTEASIDGEPYVGGFGDNLIVKYASDGTRVWTRMTGTSAYEEILGASIDSAGYLYVSGITSGSLNGEVGSGFKDIFVMKYSIMTSPTGQPTGQPSRQPSSSPTTAFVRRTKQFEIVGQEGTVAFTSYVVVPNG
eukprot:gene34329-41550_t